MEREADAEAKELRQALHAVLPETGREKENLHGTTARAASSKRPEAEGRLEQMRSTDAEARSDPFVVKLYFLVGFGSKRSAVELWP